MQLVYFGSSAKIFVDLPGLDPGALDQGILPGAERRIGNAVSFSPGRERRRRQRHAGEPSHHHSEADRERGERERAQAPDTAVRLARTRDTASH